MRTPLRRLFSSSTAKEISPAFDARAPRASRCRRRLLVSYGKMKTRNSPGPRRRESRRLHGDGGGAREIRRCLMPRLPRSVGNTYCGPQSCRDFHRTDAPVFPGAVTSCARFNLPLTSAPPYSPFRPPSSAPATTSHHHRRRRRRRRHYHRRHHHHRYHHPSRSPALTRVSFTARFVLHLYLLILLVVLPLHSLTVSVGHLKSAR